MPLKAKNTPIAVPPPPTGHWGGFFQWGPCLRNSRPKFPYAQWGDNTLRIADLCHWIWASAVEWSAKSGKWAAENGRLVSGARAKSSGKFCWNKENLIFSLGLCHRMVFPCSPWLDSRQPATSLLGCWSNHWGLGTAKDCTQIGQSTGGEQRGNYTKTSVKRRALHQLVRFFQL